MSKHICTPASKPDDPSYKKVLLTAFIINIAMFVIELVMGISAGSVALQADALDFFGDACNYAISLYLIGKTVSMRAKGSLLKAASMILFGIWVLGQAIYRFATVSKPEAEIITGVGGIALVANLFCFYLLSKFSNSDSNRLSAWLCTRNDAIGNVAVIFAGIGVYFTASNWPDLIVGTAMALLALYSAVHIIKQARDELSGKAVSHDHHGHDHYHH
jgi:cation diffusion facilitator family transporter